MKQENPMAEGDPIPKVLVVDDEPNIRELVQVALKFHGCAVTTGATGKDALQLAATDDPDLIVLDVMLPDIDGFEVCRRLRASDNDVPVIFLTARDTTSDTVTGLTLGGDDYITKPFSIREFRSRVRALLRRASIAAKRLRTEVSPKPSRFLSLERLFASRSASVKMSEGVLINPSS